MVVVVFGPGGVGKGTLVRRLVEQDDRLWLSRSWTTRPRRPGEPADAYVFVDKDAFLAKESEGGFLETNRFAANDQFYGTPWPEEPPGKDVLLEIDLNGAVQVRERAADPVLVLVVPPDREELERRLRGRGDSEDHVARRLALADVEIDQGRQLADHVVVNDDLDRAARELAGILAHHRSRPPGETPWPSSGAPR
ncbi:MAG: guanylate kinase [Actinobacteria bacterium]|nr:guanylate kinase [Actinomycetota bacterium]